MQSGRSVVIGGVGTSLTVEDVVRVAFGGSVEFEPGTVERLQKHIEKDAGEALLPQNCAAENPLAMKSLSESAVRGSMFVRLATLARSKSGLRPEISLALKERLNAGELDLIMTGQLEDRALLETLANCGKWNLGLAPHEKVVFCSGSSFSSAIAALNLHAGQALLPLAQGIAALSCEALAASIKALDPQRLEALGNKTAQDSAECLRTLLSGSRRVNSKKGGVGSVHGVSDIPMVHGAAIDAMASLQTSLRSELNAQALEMKALREFPHEVPFGFVSQLDAGLRSVLKILSLSEKRCGRLLERLPQMEGTDKEPSELEGLAQFLKSLQTSWVQQRGDLEGLLFKVMRTQQQEGGLPAAATAILGREVLHLLSTALALECVVALMSLALLGIPVPPVPDQAVTSDAKKDKKQNKGTGSTLGQGTSSLYRFFLRGLQALESDDSCTIMGDLTHPESVTKWMERAMEMCDVNGGKLPEAVQIIEQQIATLQVRRKPKIPKGTRDFLPDQMRIRQRVFDTITAVFKRHGAVSIDTPVFELKETLTGKYGEDSKLIYDLADQGGEILSLRYDLTVPFARYVALNSVGNIKRYHIGKVYRRDQPQMTRGRFREFFQCDFDIAGSYACMVPDAECVKVLVEVLEDLALGEFEVKINHRRLIDAMMDICGVPAPKHQTICSAIDKLDKEPWDVVKAEMVAEKGLEEVVADRLGAFVQMRDKPKALLAKLTEPQHPFMQHADAAAALEEVRVLIGYLEHMKALEHLVWDLSLARGLDYYSGLIYEAVYSESGTGSVAAGGRYDKLVGMFSGKDVPAVGVSIGVERVFSIMERQMKQTAQSEGTNIRTNDTQVLVGSIGNGLQQKRMELCAALWSAGIAAEFGYKPNPKMADNFDYALNEGIPYMVLFGETELEVGVVKIKDLAARTEEIVAMEELIPEMRRRLG